MWLCVCVAVASGKEGREGGMRWTSSVVLGSVGAISRVTTLVACHIVWRVVNFGRRGPGTEQTSLIDNVA